MPHEGKVMYLWYGSALPRIHFHKPQINCKTLVSLFCVRLLFFSVLLRIFPFVFCIVLCLCSHLVWNTSFFDVLFLRFLSVIFNVVCFHSCFCLFVFWFLRVLFWYSNSPNRPQICWDNSPNPRPPLPNPPPALLYMHVVGAIHQNDAQIRWDSSSIHHSPNRRPDSVRQLIKSPSALRPLSTPPLHVFGEATHQIDAQTWWDNSPAPFPPMYSVRQLTKWAPGFGETIHQTPFHQWIRWCNSPRWDNSPDPFPPMYDPFPPMYSVKQLTK